MNAPFHSFRDPQTGDLSWDAAAEQMALLAVIRQSDADGVERLLKACKPDAELLHFYFADDEETDAERIIPSHVLVAQRGEYWLAINGTENAAMWAKNVSGVFLRQSWGDDANAVVHGYFGFAADKVFLKIFAKIPDKLRATLNISGHSLGAAAANLLGLKWKATFPESTVNVIGFGEPKSVSGDYDGTPLDFKVRVTNDNDPVVRLPIAGQAMTTGGVAFNLPTVFAYGSWQHSGPQQRIKEDGTVRGEEGPAGAVTPQSSLYERTVKAHFPRLYLKSLAAVHKGRGKSQGSAAMLSYALRQGSAPEAADHFGLPSFDEFVNVQALNEAVGGGQTAPFDSQNWRGFTVSRVEATTATVGPEGSLQSGFSGNRGVSAVMATITTTSLWRVVVHLNNALYGDSHSIVMRGPRDNVEAITLAEQWVSKRAALLGASRTQAEVQGGNRDPSMGTPVYQWMVVQDALNPRDSVPKVLSYQTGGPWSSVANGNTAADFFANALSVRMLGISDAPDSRRAYHVESFVGFPDKALENGKIVWGVKMKPDLTFEKAMDDYLELISNSQHEFGFLGQDQSVPKKLVTSFTTDADSQLKCTVTGHGYTSGDWIRLSGKVGKKNRRTYRASVIDANTITLLSSKVRDDEIPREGYVQRVRMADGTRQTKFYRFQRPTALDFTGKRLVKITSRKPRPKSIPISFTQKGRKG